jgi:hypothetical protein
VTTTTDRVAWWKRPETTYRVLVQARRCGETFTFTELAHKVASHEHVKLSRAESACGRAKKLRAIVRVLPDRPDGQHVFRLTIIGRRLLVAGALEADRLDRWDDE